MTAHSVYRLFDADARLLYVGCSQNLERRLNEHARVQPWWDDVASVTSEEFPTRGDARRAESEAISWHHPVYNLHGYRVRRASEYMELISAGETISSVALRYGITRQAVHQDLPRWFMPLIKRRRAARKRLQQFERYHFVCIVCGADSVDASRSRFCREECRLAWMAFRSHLPGHDEKHRQANARCALRMGERYAAHARRVLSDNSPPKNRVWLRPGGAADRYARRAYAEGWPIFDLLPEEIRDRIAGRGATADRECERCGEPFVGRRQGANRFCSTECYHAAGIGISREQAA